MKAETGLKQHQNNPKKDRISTEPYSKRYSGTISTLFLPLVQWHVSVAFALFWWHHLLCCDTESVHQRERNNPKRSTQSEQLQDCIPLYMLWGLAGPPQKNNRLAVSFRSMEDCFVNCCWVVGVHLVNQIFCLAYGCLCWACGGPPPKEQTRPPQRSRSTAMARCPGGCWNQRGTYTGSTSHKKNLSPYDGGKTDKEADLCADAGKREKEADLCAASSCRKTGVWTTCIKISCPKAIRKPSPNLTQIKKKTFLKMHLFFKLDLTYFLTFWRPRASQSLHRAFQNWGPK